jgi:SpoVK/Ycf46/Vps4 family AAA+-type ATPase
MTLGVPLFVFRRGAARVRQLFARAGKQAPCIIFMDELDTLGKQRSLRVGGSNDEVEQTLNQLLACMDGLDTNKSGVRLAHTQGLQIARGGTTGDLGLVCDAWLKGSWSCCGVLAMAGDGGGSHEPVRDFG